MNGDENVTRCLSLIEDTEEEKEKEKENEIINSRTQKIDNEIIVAHSDSTQRETAKKTGFI